MPRNELKPCPFCGGEAEEISSHASLFNTRNCWAIRCKSCGANGGAAWHPKKAAENWNTRDDTIPCTPLQNLIDRDRLANILEAWEETAADGTENDGTDGTTRIVHAVATNTQEMLDLIADQPRVAAVPAEFYMAMEDKYKKMMETCTILDDALREYQRKYGE